MKLYYNEVIAPALRGTQHNKIFSIWGDDFAFQFPDFSFKYLKTLSNVFKKKAKEVWG